MNINTTKIISLLFFIFSSFYLYTAYQIQVFSFDENAPFNARTFPIYLGYAGLFFSGLKLILPDPNTIKIPSIIPLLLSFARMGLLNKFQALHVTDT